MAYIRANCNCYKWLPLLWSFGSLSNIISVLKIPLWGSSKNLGLHPVVTNQTILAYYWSSGKWSHFVYPSYLYVVSALSSFPGSFFFPLVFFLHRHSFSSLRAAHSLLSSKVLPISFLSPDITCTVKLPPVHLQLYSPALTESALALSHNSIFSICLHSSCYCYSPLS